MDPNEHAKTVVGQLLAKVDKTKTEEELFEDARLRGVLALPTGRGKNSSQFVRSRVLSRGSSPSAVDVL